METKTKQGFGIIVLCGGIIVGVSLAFTPIAGFFVALLLAVGVFGTEGSEEIF